MRRLVQRRLQPRRPSSSRHQQLRLAPATRARLRKQPRHPNQRQIMESRLLLLLWSQAAHAKATVASASASAAAAASASQTGATTTTYCHRLSDWRAVQTKDGKALLPIEKRTRRLKLPGEKAEKPRVFGGTRSKRPMERSTMFPVRCDTVGKTEAASRMDVGEDRQCMFFFNRSLNKTQWKAPTS